MTAVLQRSSMSLQRVTEDSGLFGPATAAWDLTTESTNAAKPLCPLALLPHPPPHGQQTHHHSLACPSPLPRIGLQSSTNASVARRGIVNGQRMVCCPMPAYSRTPLTALKRESGNGEHMVTRVLPSYLQRKAFLAVGSQSSTMRESYFDLGLFASSAVRAATREDTAGSFVPP